MQTFQLAAETVFRNQLAFAQDGLRAAAVDATGKVVVWDVDE